MIQVTKKVVEYCIKAVKTRNAIRDDSLVWKEIEEIAHELFGQEKLDSWGLTSYLMNHLTTRIVTDLENTIKNKYTFN